MTGMPGAVRAAPELTKEQAIAAADAEMQQAIDRVVAIVNQPAPSYPRELGVPVYPGWFHPGAITPDFNHVDVSKTQQLDYSKDEFVSSTTTPTVMFRGTEIVFNPQTKFFVSNRDLPMKRLSEAELLEINRLYRIIGQDEGMLAAMTGKSAVEADDTKPPAKKLPLVPIIAVGVAAAAVLYLFARKKRA